MRRSAYRAAGRRFAVHFLEGLAVGLGLVVAFALVVLIAR